MGRLADVEGLRAYLLAGVLAIAVYVVAMGALVAFSVIELTGGVTTFAVGFGMFMLIYFASMIYAGTVLP